MKTSEDVRRVKLLLQTVDDAREWRETFEDEGNLTGGQNVVGFEDVYLQKDVAGPQSRFDGALVMPRDLAIDMLLWLGARAREELAKLEVRIP